MRYILLLALLPLHFLLHAQTVKVERVIDGDTYVIETGEKVRMVGIDAPEMSTVFGDDAKEHLQRLIEGKTITLKPDSKTGDKDRYNRLLRYTMLNGEDINLRMVCDGYAIAYTRFKFSQEKTYTTCQQNAESSDAGMWLQYEQDDLFKKKNNKQKGKKKKPESKKKQPKQPVEEPLTNYATEILISLAIIVAVYLLKKIKQRK